MEISVEYIQEVAMHMYQNLLLIGENNGNSLVEQFPMNEFGVIEINNDLYPGFEGRIMRSSDENDTYRLILEIKKDDRVWLQTINL